MPSALGKQKKIISINMSVQFVQSCLICLPFHLFDFLVFVTLSYSFKIFFCGFKVRKMEWLSSFKECLTPTGFSGDFISIMLGIQSGKA